jgi:hypothetical protein
MRSGTVQSFGEPYEYQANNVPPPAPNLHSRPGLGDAGAASLPIAPRVPQPCPASHRLPGLVGRR